MPRRAPHRPQPKPLPAIVIKRCRKTWFRSEEHANKILDKILRDPKTDKVPCRAYQCPKCKGWHLTSLGLAEDGR